MIIVKNKLSHFSSKETGKPIVVNTFGNISYSENSDPSLMSVTLKACHCGVNRNNSKITEEVMKKHSQHFQINQFWRKLLMVKMERKILAVIRLLSNQMKMEKNTLII